MNKWTQNINSELVFTPWFLSKVSGLDINDLVDVRNNNKELTSKNLDLVEQSGYLSFYDMCIDSISNEQSKLEKGGNKDYSKLTPVEQTVIRNGKPTKMKIYVDKNKENKDNENELDTQSGREPVNATELNRNYSFGDLESKANPNKVAELQEEISEWETKETLSTDSQEYLEGRDESGALRYLVGFSKKGSYIQVDFFITDGTISGDWLSAFYELVKLSLNYKLGAKFPDLKTRALYLIAQEYNFETKGAMLVATYENLIEAVGDM